METSEPGDRRQVTAGQKKVKAEKLKSGKLGAWSGERGAWRPETGNRRAEVGERSEGFLTTDDTDDTDKGETGRGDLKKRKR